MNAKYIAQTGRAVGISAYCQPNSRQRILVVADDQSSRRLNSMALTCSGYEVDTAQDGATAWDAVQLQNYDLMIVDTNMPSATGIDLIQKLQVAGISLSIIMATSTLPIEKCPGCASLQPVVILPKPYTFEELFEAVKAVLCASNQGREQIAPPNWQGRPLAGLYQL
jgi:DNA-binding response OmpR family regulator